MVSKAQKKLQKQRAREKETKKKIREKRERMREPARLEREERRRDKRIKKLQNDMAGLQQWEEETLKNVSDETLSQLEHNAKILRALETEHEAEVTKKRELHEGLEEQGHVTLEDKMNAIRTLEQQKQMEEMGVGGSAECAVTAAPPAPPKKRRKKDTSIVEVIKAPKNEENADS